MINCDFDHVMSHDIPLHLSSLKNKEKKCLDWPIGGVYSYTYKNEKVSYDGT